MAPEASGAVRRTVEFDPAKLDRDALRVVAKLREAGFTSYLVGGCVRDLLAGLSPKDFDVSTDARPRQVRRVFRNARIIGRRFRLVHVRFGENIIETATFRRNPREDEEPPADDDEVLLREDNVFGTPEEDANRRDFTINGLFYDPEAKEVIDYVGGLADMEKGIVRTIDDPWLRFREPLRLARWLDPDAAERLRMEIAWPVLRPLAHTLERAPGLRDDSVAQAGARLIYHFSCPASRASCSRR